MLRGESLFNTRAVTGALLVTLALGGTSCRAVKGAFGDPDADVRSSASWVMIPTFERGEERQRTIFVSVRNPVGAVELEGLERQIESSALDRGFTVTRDPAQCDLYYEVMIRFFDENMARDNGQSLLELAGGNTVTLSAWAETPDAEPGAIVLPSAPPVPGSGSRAGRVAEWNVLVDVAIGDRTGTGQADFVRREARLLAVTRQIDMTREEAGIALVERIRTAMGSIVP